MVDKTPPPPHIREQLDESFDRDIKLSALFSAEEARQLLAAVGALLGVPCRLLSAGGKVLAGSEVPEGALRAPLRGDLEPVGYLQAASDEPTLYAAAQLLERVVRTELRYRMAARLHEQTVHSSYEELQRRHDALKRSQQRYKELNHQLEERVARQVAVVEDAQRRLYQSEKMASVGQLAAGVAHEVNNPMGFIRSNLQTAQDYLDTIHAALARHDGALDTELLDDFRDLLQESEVGARRVTRIVSALKDFSHADGLEMAPADVNGILQRVTEVLRGQVPAGVTVYSEFTEELPVLRCHSGSLGEVFYNLILNALQAVADGGRVLVRSFRDGDHLGVAVEDNGPGIEPDVQRHLFEPFFTTKEVGKGTGLGLSVAYDVVRAHGGRIKVHSVPARGTRFTVLLPLAGGQSSGGKP